ncbi:TonB-dependent siderophore receptor [Piscinibacter sp.]|uniref:TonB-dependent siderophore receptor n=1 Tax=Piscinibacter sp. TaxID=1903157 RepID=UPI0039E356D9
MALTLALGAAALPPAARAQAAAALPAGGEVHVFDLPAGPLRPALAQFERATGVALSYDAALVDGVRTQGVTGSHGIAAALSALLAGSDLEAVSQPGGGYVLRRTVAAAPASASQDATLAAVKVTASSLRDGVTEGTRSYTTDGSAAATGLNLSLRETPQSVTVITRERMDEAGINSLGDAVAQAPGIAYQPMGSPVGGYSPLWARGYQVQSFMLDDIPVSAYAISAGGAWQGLTNIDSAVYDSVTVIRGATGLMTGAGDPSATVALTRKRPTPAFRASLSQSFGSWQKQRTVGDVGGPLNEAGTLRGRLVGAYEAGHGWKEGYRYDKSVVYGVLEADLSSRTLATLALEASDDKARGGAAAYTGYAVDDVDGNPTPFGRRDNSAADWSRYGSRRLGLTATLEHRFSDDWQVKLSYHRATVKDHQSFGLASWSPDADGIGQLHLRSYRRHNDVDAALLKLDGRYELWGRKHELVAGINGYREDQTAPQWFMDWDNYFVNVYTWNRRFPEPDWPALYEFGWRDKVSQYGAYTATRLHVTEQLSVLAGARWTRWRSRGFDEAGGVIEDRKENGVLTPYLGVVYDFAPNLSAYASYTSIFNPQSYRDVNGSLLDPETGTNIEAGVKGEWFGGRLNASVAVFQVKKNDLAVLDPPNLTPGGDDAYRAEDDTRGRGWEVEVAGEPLPGWRVQGGYTRMLTRDSSGGRLMTDASPEHLFKMFTTWTPASLNQLTVGGGVTWQSRTWVDGMSALYAQKSYAVLNLMARYAFSEPLTLTVNLNNVFDKVYRTDMWGHDYGAPRDVQATLQYKF